MSRVHSTAAALILTGAGVLIGAAPTPAQARAAYCGCGYFPNGTSLTGLTQVHSIGSTGLLSTGSSVSDMNGVRIEGVTLPTKEER